MKCLSILLVGLHAMFFVSNNALALIECQVPNQCLDATWSQNNGIYVHIFGIIPAKYVSSGSLNCTYYFQDTTDVDKSLITGEWIDVAADGTYNNIIRESPADPTENCTKNDDFIMMISCSVNDMNNTLITEYNIRSTCLI